MWGKMIGGVAGFFMGGPFGAIMGAALGHAADSGALPGQAGFGFVEGGAMGGPFRLQQMRAAALLGQKEHVFAVGVVVLSAKLAKCDGAVTRPEIDAFKRQFRIPAEQMREVGRLFDQARDGSDRHEPYATQMAALFAGHPATLEDVLAALFQIARADGAINNAEHVFLSSIHAAFGLDQRAWDRARGAAPRTPPSTDPDPYTLLGVPRTATDIELRTTWKQLMRENHPDSLAARGVPPELIAKAADRVARINGAWDRIKRERGL